MAESNTEVGLKEKVLELFGTDTAVNKIIWELFPDYCKLKLSHLKVISGGIKTNETGNEIKTSFHIINLLSVEDIIKISAVLDIINKSSSNNWNPCYYSYQPIVDIEGENSLFKYIFTCENHTNEFLADKNVVQFKLF